jgi:predicted PhzF superfamily epimerase YddE/YHI9
MSFTAPFTIFNVFTSREEGGNPAAVVFLPTFKLKSSSETLQEIATSLNQPITVFLSHSGNVVNGGEASFDVRWFTSTMEMPINGHGLVAAAAALFSPDSSGCKLESFDLSSITTRIQFRSPSNVVLTTCRHSLTNWYELELPSSLTTPIPLDSDEGRRLELIVGRALHQANDNENVIVYIGKGGKGYENYLMVELDKKVDLGAREVDTSALVSLHFVFSAAALKQIHSSDGDAAIYDQRVHLGRTSRHRCRVRIKDVCASGRIT